MNRDSFYIAAGVVALARFVAWLWGLWEGEPAPDSWLYGVLFVGTYAHCEWEEFKKEWQEFKQSSSRKD